MGGAANGQQLAKHRYRVGSRLGQHMKLHDTVLKMLVPNARITRDTSVDKY
jgi:hypothetical protein